jgi:uridine kinase
VAIDGIDAAGKTTLADELTLALLARQRAVIRASIDGFHRPRAERYRQGSESSVGYYEDAFNYESLQKLLLLPLGPGGHRKYRRVAFDLHQNAPATIPVETATSTAALLVDGVFLLRPELNYYWEYRIFVDVTFEVALRRAEVRDRAHFSSLSSLRDRYQHRYFPAQRFYLEAIGPKRLADVVVENSDPRDPKLTFRRSEHAMRGSRQWTS